MGKRDEVKFSYDPGERRIILAIAQRAHRLVGYDVLDVSMDINATHANGNPLHLKKLLEADDFNFIHDVGGIRTHLDRETGKLQNCFSPRFSDNSAEAA